MTDEEMQSAMEESMKQIPQELKDEIVRSLIRFTLEEEGSNVDDLDIDDEIVQGYEAELPDGLLDKACMELNDYMERELPRILREMETEKKVLNQERYNALLAAYALLYVLCDEEHRPTVKIHRAFNAGSVSITAPVIDLDRKGIFILGRALRNCDNLEFVPQTDGNVYASVTVQHVLLSAK